MNQDELQKISKTATGLGCGMMGLGCLLPIVLVVFMLILGLLFSLFGGSGK